MAGGRLHQDAECKGAVNSFRHSGARLFGANPESRRLRCRLDSGFAPPRRASRGALTRP
jgi:hypothetical protein